MESKIWDGGEMLIETREPKEARGQCTHVQQQRNGRGQVKIGPSIFYTGKLWRALQALRTVRPMAADFESGQLMSLLHNRQALLAPWYCSRPTFLRGREQCQ